MLRKLTSEPNMVTNSGNYRGSFAILSQFGAPVRDTLDFVKAVIISKTFKPLFIMNTPQTQSKGLAEQLVKGHFFDFSFLQWAKVPAPENRLIMKNLLRQA